MTVLSRFQCVDRVMSWENGRLHYRIDLATLPAGDGPAAALQVQRALKRAVTLHQAE